MSQPLLCCRISDVASNFPRWQTESVPDFNMSRVTSMYADGTSTSANSVAPANSDRQGVDCQPACSRNRPEIVSVGFLCIEFIKSVLKERDMFLLRLCLSYRLAKGVSKEG